MDTPLCICDDTVARMVYELEWRSAEATHREALHVGRANFWRDIFPAGLRRQLEGLCAGAHAEVRLPQGCGPRNPALVQTIPRSRFGRSLRGPMRGLEPRMGRFYPKGLVDGLTGVFPQDMTPLRVTGLSAETFTADFNHPLAGRDLTLRASVLEVMEKPGDTGGQCRHVLECLTDGGPGMQARHQGQATDFGDAGPAQESSVRDRPLSRADEADDRLFYAQPRQVAHLDATCRANLEALYARLLPVGPEPLAVLDLMSSRFSHLGQALAQGSVGSVAGLGMNAQELESNPELASRCVHDLNAEPQLPYADDSFDAVLCTASVEYLTRPRLVMAEAVRVLKPGGLMAVTFSNRWFPTKANSLWAELHDFERMGWVLGMLAEDGRLEQLQTLSMRGWPRPWDPEDRYVDRLKSADPLYAVWGRIRN